MRTRLTHQNPHSAFHILKLKEAGFTIVELMITMAVFLLVIASVSSVFTGVLTQFKQQSKIGESNIEGLIGVDILRRDIEHSGYGLPWIIPAGVAYNEASATPASTYNDAVTGVPRGILSGNNTGINNSDYLVIKSVNAARNSACEKWTTLSTGNVKRTWTPNIENVNINTDGSTNNNIRVIVLSPGGTTGIRTLVASGSVFFTTYGNTAAFAPADTTSVNVIYGVDPDTDLRMPFNRADYSISSSSVPARCAPGTGVLTKTIISQASGGTTNALPILDCVADFQVIYLRDTNADSIIDNQTDDISILTAQQIREQVKEVRAYILSHEGQIDTTYAYPGSSITLGEYGLGSTFNLSSAIGSTYANYRWKIYTLVVKPNNLK